MTTLQAITGAKTRIILVALFATLIGIYALLQYGLAPSSAGFMHMKKGMELGSLWMPMLIVHALGGGMALAVGWTQFVAGFRARYKQLHRYLGGLYLLSASASAVAGLYVAFYASGGIAAKVGFGLLTVLWLITLVMAFFKINGKDVEGQQRWAFRSYALSFAAVTLRLYLMLAGLALGPQNTMIVYPAVAWLAWVPNLIFIEWFLLARKKGQVSV